MSCLEKQMKRFYDQAQVTTYLKQTSYEAQLSGFKDSLFVVEYEKGEFVTSPFRKDNLFQIVIQGSVNIFFIRDDGSLYSLAAGKENYLLGEIEIFSNQMSSVYAQADEDSICLAISIENNKVDMLENSQFLQMVAASLAKKMRLITSSDITTIGLKQRVLTYMRYKCAEGKLKGLQRAAFHLNCSVRQLQRILNQYETEGKVHKIGKGAYQLIEPSLKAK